MISAKAQRFKWSPAKGGFHPLLARDYADDSQRGGRRRAPLTEMFRIFSINISTNIFPSSPLGWNSRIGFKRHYFRTSAHQPKKSCVRKGHGTSCVLLHSIPRAKCGTKAERVWNKHSASVRSKVRFAPLSENSWCAWISRDPKSLIFYNFTMCTFRQKLHSK